MNEKESVPTKTKSFPFDPREHFKNQHHMATFRYPAMKMLDRFYRQKLGREGLEKAIKDFWRVEIFGNALRFCYRASQPEYKGEDNLGSDLWNRCRRALMTAQSKIEVKVWDTHVTISFQFVSTELGAKFEIQRVLMALLGSLAYEQMMCKRMIESMIAEKQTADPYLVWQRAVFEEAHTAIETAEYFPDDWTGLTYFGREHVWKPF